MKDDALTEIIIGCAYKVHNTLGSGFLEKVYRKSLAIEVAKKGLRAEQEFPIKVFYEGQEVGEYFADLLIEDRVVIELKAVRYLGKEHEVQLVNYLTATGIEIGLLINFGASVQIRRKHKTFKPSPTNPVNLVNPV
jgi:GxxExxY protein